MKRRATNLKNKWSKKKKKKRKKHGINYARCGIPYIKALFYASLLLLSLSLFLSLSFDIKLPRT